MSYFRDIKTTWYVWTQDKQPKRIADKTDRSLRASTWTRKKTPSKVLNGTQMSSLL